MSCSLDLFYSSPIVGTSKSFSRHACSYHIMRFSFFIFAFPVLKQYSCCCANLFFNVILLISLSKTRRIIVFSTMAGGRRLPQSLLRENFVTFGGNDSNLHERLQCDRSVCKRTVTVNPPYVVFSSYSPLIHSISAVVRTITLT